jgi:hypothetical protein
MNSNVMPSRIQMAKEQLENLTKVVNETVVNQAEKNFTTVDLWSIQRGTKPALRNKLTDRWKM